MEDAITKAIDEVGGILAAIGVAIALRWSARRWPLPGEDGHRPRRGRRDRRPDYSDDPEPEED